MAVHLILYVREVYPIGIFQKRKKYNVPVQVGVFPGSWQPHEWTSQIASIRHHSPEQTKSLPELVLMRKLMFEENLVPVKRDHS